MRSTFLLTLRGGHDLRSAALAICSLFLVAILVGTFASTASADPAEGWNAVHCLDLADDDEGDATASCCVLGCPMVATALPGPAGPALPTLPETDLVSAHAAIAGPPPPTMSAVIGARGPPLS